MPSGFMDAYFEITLQHQISYKDISPRTLLVATRYDHGFTRFYEVHNVPAYIQDTLVDVTFIILHVRGMESPFSQHVFGTLRVYLTLFSVCTPDESFDNSLFLAFTNVTRLLDQDFTHILASGFQPLGDLSTSHTTALDKGDFRRWSARGVLTLEQNGAEDVESKKLSRNDPENLRNYKSKRKTSSLYSLTESRSFLQNLFQPLYQAKFPLFICSPNRSEFY
ncbi:hypothetical protein VNO77_39529 [Canavalia gladiata]|uniref:Uncharacterized protein n=1 Tax=Canavalia gladiata TaxID=3824 RepID=A0AAN9PZV5_CANGL